MMQLDKKVSEYIAKAENFAIPVLKHWRKLVHQTCPDVVENIKWGIPHFDYKGDYMCVIASYKKHCSFSFVKAELMSDPRLKDSKKQKPIQRFLGKITTLSDLPDDQEFVKLLREAMQLNEDGIKIKAVSVKKDSSKILEMPAYFAERLNAYPQAKEIFETKSKSFRKEYIVWISDAKTEETRNKRMDEAIEWIAEGKSRFWKFKN